MFEHIVNFIGNFIGLFTESSLWLLLGLFIAGLMKWMVPLELLKRHMGKNDLLSVIKAAFIGAPLPLCSCGVIPAAIGLRRAGASKPASISFLVATPETGVDSISVSYALLGPFMAIIRPVAAIFSAIYAGILVMFVSEKAPNQDEQNNEQNMVHADPEKSSSHSCCASKKTENQKKPESITLLTRLKNLYQFSTGKLLDDIIKWLMIGLLLAAAIKTWVPTDFLTQWGDGFLAMLVMALIGIPMYICATASTPIAAGFLALGVSPGAVLVFMLAGPATNLSTMGMIRQEMGNKVLLIYLFSIFSASISIGYFTNWAVASFGFEINKVASHIHEMNESPVYIISAIILALLILKNLILQVKRSFHKRNPQVSTKSA
ncbi:SO_0444 family Cu/Zn efflux transporter [Aliikangiella maris]|uniref:SO_0444 family Cu/Zn efflux transporter n=2 Tax=Aliikangiella maris TaxID=3162458 RepID=A0ABV2BSN7_9GAMM